MSKDPEVNQSSPSGDDEEKRKFILQIVQPGLAGLMDGTVSSLAPLFAAALATESSRTAFLVGLATAVGAGISMAFSEALSDDGKLSGRGSPWIRGIVEGFMTFLGAIGHALPFLIPHFWTAFIVASVVVGFELIAIAYIRNKYMDTPFLKAAFQIIVGGIIVLTAGILIGKS
jgi:erythrin-vacuolar iron transport family protein